MERILIVKLSALGDVIHTLPMLHALRTSKPQAFIGWVVEDLSAELLANHPELNKVYVIPKKRWRSSFIKSLGREIVPFLRKIRSDDYKVAIDAQGLTKSGLVAWLSGAKLRVGFGDYDGREINKIFTNKRIVPPSNKKHVIERNLELLTAVSIKSAEIDFVIPIGDEHKQFAYEYYEQKGIKGRAIAVNPGAGWETKRLDLLKLAELSVRIKKELGCEVIICWGPGERSMAETITRYAKRKGVHVFMAPRTSILQLGAILQPCSAYVGGDTAPTHLAAALNVPVLAFYGASDAKRNSPWNSKSKVIQKKIKCVPCWKTKCPLPNDLNLRCLKEITVDEMIHSLRLILEK